MACTFTFPLQWFKHLFVEHIKVVCAARRLRWMHAPYFAYHPNRYLVYISLINYMFNFCALRFMLVIFLIGFWLVFFLFKLSIMLVVCLFFHSRLIFYCTSISLFHLVYWSRLIYARFDFSNERWTRNWCESVLQMSCVCTTRGIA